ncbi:hypothetical protein FB45DRAFT_1050283 [Roridomyces roridus]|uniref:Uncharacterized protein n=1 Tax=Roridomyces roridus TaxID=1738132 RepID=A0AAD7G1Z1_9AGAR|nr:hypothetical protein FB45DRAFT_1050283 [Roridomyces roridus]
MKQQLRDLARKFQEHTLDNWQITRTPVSSIGVLEALKATCRLYRMENKLLLENDPLLVTRSSSYSTPRKATTTSATGGIPRRQHLAGEDSRDSDKDSPWLTNCESVLPQGARMSCTTNQLRGIPLEDLLKDVRLSVGEKNAIELRSIRRLDSFNRIMQGLTIYPPLDNSLRGAHRKVWIDIALQGVDAPAAALHQVMHFTDFQTTMSGKHWLQVTRIRVSPLARTPFQPRTSFWHVSWFGVGL